MAANVRVMDLSNATVIRGPEQFRRWCRTAPDGAKAIYHVGFLFNDRQTSRPQDRDTEAKVIDSIAKVAMDLYKDGRVDLVQSKVLGSANTFNYVAIRRARKT